MNYKVKTFLAFLENKEFSSILGKHVSVVHILNDCIKNNAENPLNQTDVA